MKALNIDSPLLRMNSKAQVALDEIINQCKDLLDSRDLAVKDSDFVFNNNIERDEMYDYYRAF